MPLPQELPEISEAIAEQLMLEMHPEAEALLQALENGTSTASQPQPSALIEEVPIIQLSMLVVHDLGKPICFLLIDKEGLTVQQFRILLDIHLMPHTLIYGYW